MKRATDVVLSVGMLVVSAPVLFIALVAVKLSSRGPVLYTQSRVGLDHQPFTIFKIRTMRQDAENLTGAQWSTPGDSRITPVGRILRRLHLDELPQLYNVLRGDMSLIGPRPERPEFVPQLEKALPGYAVRLLVPPGLTGIAQVQLPPDSDLDSVRRKLSYDVYYVRHATLWLDARILAATAGKIAHVPFHFIQQVFGFPELRRIDEDYRTMLEDQAKAPTTETRLER